jgi:hypothetical protein
MTSTQTIKNWFHYFKVEATKPEYGTFDHFDAVPPLYVNDTEEFKKQFAANPLETLMLLPGPERTVRLLHNCTVDNNNKKAQWHLRNQPVFTNEKDCRRNTRKTIRGRGSDLH